MVFLIGISDFRPLVKLEGCYLVFQKTSKYVYQILIQNVRDILLTSQVLERFLSQNTKQ